MLKLVAILLVIIVLFRWALGYWPWDLARGPDPKARELAAARRLLSVSDRADRTEIMAAHKLLITRVHPDRGGSEEAARRANEARDLLLAELSEPQVGTPANGDKAEDANGSDEGSSSRD